MNWYEVLPEQIAINQIAYERRHRVLHAVLSGAKQKEIAAKLGISASIVSQMVWKALREDGRKPPVTVWCEQWAPDMIRPLEHAAWLKDRRQRRWERTNPPRQMFEPWP